MRIFLLLALLFAACPVQARLSPEEQAITAGVDRENDAFQQGMPASPSRRSHELHSSRPKHWIRQAALSRSYNPLISCGFQPVAKRRIANGPWR